MYACFVKTEHDNLAEPIDFLKYGFFEKTPAERAEYLTRRQYSLLCKRVNDAALAGRLEDKLAFLERYKRFLGRSYVVARDGSHDAFLRLCETNGELVVKPRCDGYGRGIQIAETSQPESLWETCLEGGAIVEEKIVQHAGLAALHPSSVNCVRAVTAIGPDGNVSLIAAALRCGRGSSITDSGDGLFATIDLESGCVAGEGISHFSEHFEMHPDTGTPFRGFAIPHFDGLCSTVCAIAAEVPALRLMNWDLACREDGAWCLIEGNFAGGIGPCQEAGGAGLARAVNDALGLEFGGSDA